MGSPSINSGIESGKTFAERAGSPAEVPAALGLVVLSFAGLERSLSRSIASELRAGELAGETVAAELSFKQKLQLMSSLLQIPRDEQREPVSPRAADVGWDAVKTKCFQAEELRNRLMHSSWEPSEQGPDTALRFKRSAKAHRGLHTSSEVLDSAAILDVAEFIDSVIVDVDHFFRPPVVRL